MGVYRSHNFSDAMTPICNNCGVALCWDISEDEYLYARQFWDEWICSECNNGQPLSLKDWKKLYIPPVRHKENN